MRGESEDMALEDLLTGGPGHNGYAYQADVYCVKCGQEIIRSLWREGKIRTVEKQIDTDDCPQPIFFGESPGCAEHCADCREYLYGESNEKD